MKIHSVLGVQCNAAECVGSCSGMVVNQVPRATGTSMIVCSSLDESRIDSIILVL